MANEFIARNGLVAQANSQITGSLSQGSGISTIGSASHAEGINTFSSGQYSHAEGQQATAIGIASHRAHGA